MALPVPLFPDECTTPEAWAELVRGERQSALNTMEELTTARQAVAHLAAENARLLGALSAAPTKGG